MQNNHVPRLALIGGGAITELFYLPALATHPGLSGEIVLVDLDRARAEALTSKFGLGGFVEDYRTVLEEVDGAIVAVPTHLHYTISMDFLRQGTPVLCEKPLALSAAEAREMVQQAKESGTSLAVNYTRRLYPSFRKVKEILTEKILGEPLHITYAIREEFSWPTVSGFYFNATRAPRGILLDRGVHVLDLICWWLDGRPDLLSSENDSFGGPEAVARVHLQRGLCQVQVELSLLGKSASRFYVECESGSLEGDIYEFKSLVQTRQSGRRERLQLHGEETFYWDFGKRLVANFVDVVRGTAQPLVSGSDTLDSLDLIDECYAAAQRFDMPWYTALESGNV